MFRKDSIKANKKPKFTAYIGLEGGWWDYYRHYKTAIDFLTEGIEGNVSVNTVSLPLMFLIRHSMELAFKANILKFECVNINIEKLELKGKGSHSLILLYDKFKEHLFEFKSNYTFDVSVITTIENYLAKTEALKFTLHELDKGSYNFRYPVDTSKSRANIFSSDKVVNIADIIEALYSLQPFLVFIDQVLLENGVIEL